MEEEEELEATDVPHVVTEEEAAAGAYTMDDVVLPLPGAQVVLPRHASADVYRELAAQGGVSLDASPHCQAEFCITSLPGAYRHVLYRPTDLKVGAGGRGRVVGMSTPSCLLLWIALWLPRL